MSPTIRKVAVLGVTGQQGGAVAAALLERGVQVLGITRNPDSDKAQALASKPHMTVTKGDLNDVDSLKAAFKGCDGAFIVSTFQWGVDDVGVEMQHYKNAADALKATHTIRHVVFPTLEESVIPGVTDDFKPSHEHKETGNMFIPRFDGKARSEKYFDGLPTTFLYNSCFFENFKTIYKLHGSEDGTYSFWLPLEKDEKMPFTILPDLGTLVASAFLQPDKVIGKRIGQASFYATGEELAGILTKVTGKTIKFNTLPRKTLVESDENPHMIEFGQMFELWHRKFDEFSGSRQIQAQEELMGRKVIDPVEYGKTFADKIAFQN